MKRKVTLKGGPLGGRIRELPEPTDSPPPYLASIPGFSGDGEIMRPPVDPPRSVGCYEREADADGEDSFAYTWRAPAR